MLGDYFCWTVDKKVMCYHLKAVKTVEPVAIDLKDYFVDDAGSIAIDGCMPRSLIEAGYLTAVKTKNLHKLDNYL